MDNLRFSALAHPRRVHNSQSIKDCSCYSLLQHCREHYIAVVLSFTDYGYGYGYGYVMYSVRRSLLELVRVITRTQRENEGTA
jgi:hypothetical protein